MSKVAHMAVAVVVTSVLAVTFFIALNTAACRWPYRDSVYKVRWTMQRGCEIQLTHNAWVNVSSVKVFQ